MSDIADDAAQVQHNEIQASLRDIQERRKIFGCRVESWQDGPMYCAKIVRSAYQMPEERLYLGLSTVFSAHSKYMGNSLCKP